MYILADFRNKNIGGNGDVLYLQITNGYFEMIGPEFGNQKDNNKDTISA